MKSKDRKVKVLEGASGEISSAVLNRGNRTGILEEAMFNET